VKALAVSGPRRSPAFADLPTMVEAGLPGYEMSAWGGIVTPAGTPRDLVARLNAEINTIMASPVLAERWAALSFEPAVGAPGRLFELAQREQPMWADVIRRSGAKVD
jgi:tripartite-type tricarboxylate transporter receptor subunit TctC